jgi:hypothetical protein
MLDAGNLVEKQLAVFPLFFSPLASRFSPLIGGDEESRTLDPLLARQVL